MSQVIALDADNVMVDFIARFELVMSRLFRRNITQISGQYDLAPRYGLSQDEKQLAWDTFNNENHWLTLDAMPGAVAAVNALAAAGFEIHVVTSILPSIVPHRIANFRDIGFPDMPIHAVPGKKYEKLLELSPSWFVDDYHFHIQEAKQAGVPNIAMITYSQLDLPSIHATHSSNTLSGVVDEILNQPGLTMLTRQKASR